MVYECLLPWWLATLDEEEVNMSGKASGESLNAVVIQDSPNKAATDDRSVSPIATKVLISRGLLSRLSGVLNASLDAAYRPAATGWT